MCIKLALEKVNAMKWVMYQNGAPDGARMFE